MLATIEPGDLWKLSEGQHTDYRSDYDAGIIRCGLRDHRLVAAIVVPAASHCGWGWRCHGIACAALVVALRGYQSERFRIEGVVVCKVGIKYVSKKKSSSITAK